MPTLYCASVGCGAKVTYETTKPTICPRCTKAFASAFKVTPAPVVTTTPSRVYHPRFVEAAPRVSRTVQSIRKQKGRPQREDNIDDDIEAEFGGGGEPEILEEDDDTYTEGGDVHTLARQLAASIDPSTIHIAEPSNEVIFQLEAGVGLTKKREWNKGARIERLDD